MNDIMLVMLKALEQKFNDDTIEREIVLLSKDFLITEHNYICDINSDEFEYEKLKKEVDKLDNLRKKVKEEIKSYCLKYAGSFSDEKNLNIIDKNVKDAIAFFLIQNIIYVYINHNDILTVGDEELIYPNLDINNLSSFINQIPSYILSKNKNTNSYYIECLKWYTYIIKQLSEVYKEYSYKGLLNIKRINDFIQDESIKDNNKTNLFNILYDYGKLDLLLQVKLRVI